MPKTFNPATDIPDLSGKTILVTGGNAGLGAATVAALAAHNPSHIYLTARRRAAAEATVADIKQSTPSANITILDLDLASLDSVKAAATHFNSTATRLDLLVLNAGTAANAPALTSDGYELHFGICHMGHALLTQLLMPTLLRTAADPDADVRVVVLSSRANHSFPLLPHGVDFARLKTDMADTAPMTLYGQSKMANLLFARALARRYPRLTSVALHPGLVRTDIIGKATGMSGFRKWAISGPVMAVLGISVDEGVKTQLWACVGDDVKSGGYYDPIGKPGVEHKLASDVELADRLWEWTAEELKAHGGPGWVEADKF